MARILLVDDDPDMREMTLLRLQLDGHDVTAVGDACTALRLARTAEPGFDVAVLDVLMPGTDGHELLTQIRAEERTRELPVVFYTAHTPTAAGTAGVCANAALAKGQPLSRLLATIAELT